MNDASPPGQLRAFQFSLATMFAVTTGTAVVAVVYFGVGRLCGMTALQVLTRGLGQFLFTLPIFLVWLVGLTMAIRRLNRNRLAAILTIIALGAMASGVLAMQVAQMAFIKLASSGTFSYQVMSWVFVAMQILYGILGTTCWILILAAIFARRPPDAKKPMGESD